MCCRRKPKIVFATVLRWVLNIYELLHKSHYIKENMRTSWSVLDLGGTPVIAFMTPLYTKRSYSLFPFIYLKEPQSVNFYRSCQTTFTNEHGKTITNISNDGNVEMIL